MNQAIGKDIVSVLKEGQDSLCTWNQEFVLDHDGIPINLCQVIGKNAIPPRNLDDQPQSYPKDCMYMFPNKYNGLEAKDEIQNLLDDGTPGCNIYKQRQRQSSAGYEFLWRCKKYQVDKAASFSPGKWTKDNVNVELNKGRKNKKQNSSFHRMANSKMKYLPGRKRRTADRRGTKAIIDKSADGGPVAKRTSSGRASSTDKRCHVHWTLYMSKRSGKWYLKTTSSLTHTFHPPIEDDANQLEEKDMNEEQHKYMRLMFDSGIGNQTIANIMTEVLNKQGKKGEFLAQTIKNMNEKCQQAIDMAQGISSDMTIAQRTIDKLTAYVFIIFLYSICFCIHSIVTFLHAFPCLQSTIYTQYESISCSTSNVT